MSKANYPLKHVKIAAPCQADWDQMFSFEDERVRFCSQCNQNVYNLSKMTSDEAETLINRLEGRVCVRFYRRPDGTVLTRNCPVGLRALKRRVAWAGQLLLGMLVSLLSLLGLYVVTRPIDVRLSPATMGAIAPRATEPVEQEMPITVAPTRR